MAYLHPSLEPVLRDSMGVILYQEQVMRIAIEVAGFSPAESDGFRRAMGTWRSSREMEKLHARFVDGCRRVSGLDDAQAEELFRQALEELKSVTEGLRILGDSIAFGTRAEAYLRQALTKAGIDVPLKVDLEIMKYVDQRGTKKLPFNPKVEIKDPYGLQDKFF